MTDGVAAESLAVATRQGRQGEHRWTASKPPPPPVHRQAQVPAASLFHVLPRHPASEQDASDAAQMLSLQVRF